MNKQPLKKKQLINLLKKIKKPLISSENVKLINSDERFSAEIIRSKINVPPFKNSAVDGYALPDNDFGKTNSYKVVSKITAGDNNNLFLKKGESVRIFTGAKMPKNSNSVVMQENVIKFSQKIRINKYPKFGDNCRSAGEDISKNKKVIGVNEKINFKNISILASIGKKSIKVKNKLKVGFFTSGNELVNPGQKLNKSKINNSNKYTLSTLLKKQYIASKFLGNLKDSKKRILKLLDKNINFYDVIIITGGASVGEEDHIINAIKEIGEIFFWKIAIKPGRPLAIGKIKKTIFICLPGNPVSVYLLFGMIISPFLKFLCGSKFEIPFSYSAKVNFNMIKKTARMEWLRVVIEKNNKELIVNKYLKQGSGIISSIANSDGIIEIPENIKSVKKGDVYKFYPFNEMYI
ncbi:MAG: Molybdopterin molybdenumtransferase [Alphaproteobacteria bacterium MarineAlpha5_Bin9]|nr:MAG: Molybdopterin molybdenumtransferase [Alphaproteobacteria bacterium MarineAlpha5_Bin9]|tara:strand:+ start:2113 stop:3330 length:1218 start_codon:yes stop_codon:yes gene_type:complete